MAWQRKCNFQAGVLHELVKIRLSQDY